jgi:hypothetical protein
VDKLRQLGKTIVGLHIRRGDYGKRDAFYLTPIPWYLKHLENIWCSLESPVLFVSSEDPNLLFNFSDYKPFTSNFSDYKPFTTEMLGGDAKNFYHDFYALSQCNILLIPNSTFSFTAALTGGANPIVFRSDLEKQCFVPIDVWNELPVNKYHNRETYGDVPLAWKPEIKTL